MKDKTLKEFCDMVAARKKAPGGGSVAFLNTALGCSLLMKCLPDKEPYSFIADNISKQREKFLNFVDDDAKIYNEYLRTKSNDSITKSCKLLKTGLETIIKLNLNQLLETAGYINKNILVDYDYGLLLIFDCINMLKQLLLENLRYVHNPKEKEELNGFVDKLHLYLEEVQKQHNK